MMAVLSVTTPGRDPGTLLLLLPLLAVFLLSVRSGAVGINLTAANHVFLLEPCLNPALEEQAIGEREQGNIDHKSLVLDSR
jgi:hypothetical protein